MNVALRGMQLAPRGMTLAPRGMKVALRGMKVAPRGMKLAPRGMQLALRGMKVRVVGTVVRGHRRWLSRRGGFIGMAIVHHRRATRRRQHRTSEHRMANPMGRANLCRLMSLCRF
jgi:hypothetical protein